MDTNEAHKRVLGARFGMRLTEEDKQMLSRACYARRNEIERITGQSVTLSVSDYIRWLIHRDFERVKNAKNDL